MDHFAASTKLPNPIQQGNCAENRYNRLNAKVS